MNVLFPDNPLDNKSTIDPDYEDELVAAEKNGFAAHLFSYEQLTKDNDAVRAIRRIKPADKLKKIFYRGWMLKPYQYALLYDALLEKNYQLINSPSEYQYCHYLPNSYKLIQAYTPRTIWLKLENQQVDYDQVFKAIEIFDDAALIIKDFVKSQKHFWDTACYIPSAADKTKVRSVIDRFIELQGKDLNEGLVVREFIDLNNLTVHSKSGMPLKQEYRLFFLNGTLLGCYDYWEEGQYSADENPPLDMFKDIAQRVESNFFSMDIAKTKKSEWVIIELGDGQVAGLPDKVDRVKFYELAKQYL